MRPPAILLAAAIGASTLLAGCTSPRNALGTPTGRCFEVLPQAKQALRGAGRLTGVRYTTVTDLAAVLDRLRPQIVDIPSAAARSRAAVCVVAYAGRFDAGRTARGWRADKRSGRLALVVLGTVHRRVLAIVLVPLPLERLALFER